MKTKTALTIAGSDSGGGAGTQADLKTFSALGVHGLTAITSVTAQNTEGVKGISNISAEFVGMQIDSVAEDFEIGFAKTGMVSNSEIIKKIREKILEHDIKLVVDPVMIAASGSKLLKNEAIGELKKLIGEAKLVTPNIDEAEELAGMNITTVEDMKSGARKISELGPEAVLVKGGHLKLEKIHNILFSQGEFKEFEEKRIPVKNVHGTGCSFSSAITAELAKGENLESAVENAGEFLLDSIRGRISVGKGVETVNPMASMWKVTGGSPEIKSVQKAAKKLVQTPEFAKIIPEVGTNLAMAPKNATSEEEIVGLAGRIVKVSGKPYMTGIATPGGSEHVAYIVMTAKRHDPNARAGMNIRYSEKILEICEELNLEISSFNRENEPENTRTMEWGTDRAIEKAGKVPDLIYDKGAIGKEPMIRILGEKATEVAKISIKIAERI